MGAFKALLLVIRFALELGALAALGYCGVKAGGGTFSKIVLGAGAPLVAIALWWTFVAPNAPVENGVLKAIAEAIVFGSAVLALLAVDRPQLAVTFAIVAVLDSVLVRVLDA